MTPPWRPVMGWLRRHPQIADGALAVLLLVVQVAFYLGGPPPEGEPDPDLAGPFIIAATLALTWRRRNPLGVLAVVFAADITLVLLGYEPVGAPLPEIVASYTAGAHARSRRATATAVVLLLTGIALTALFVEGIDAGDIVAALAIFLGALAFGRSVGLRRAYLRSLEERSRQLESLREAELREVVQGERARIARELHDVVAHHVSVMTVQASAARRQLDRDPARSREALTAMEAVGRAAMSEMRRMVGVLRAAEDDSSQSAIPPGGVSDQPGLTPQPGLDELPTLLEQMEQAGLPVDLAVEGRRLSLPRGIELTAYRIIQEALTNTLKHGGPTRAEVTLYYTPDDFTVCVADRGRGLAAELGAASRPVGHGLLGMRERVDLYGGVLYTGPRAGGGFEVRVRLPLDSTHESPTATGR